MPTIEPIGDTYELPMRVDVHNSAQNAFVQAWLEQWSETFHTKEKLAEFYHLPVEHFAIEALWRQDVRQANALLAITDIQGTYDYDNHGRNSHTFSDKFPTIHNAVIHTQTDPEEEGYGALRVSGRDVLGRKVWIEIIPVPSN